MHRLTQVIDLRPACFATFYRRQKFKHRIAAVYLLYLRHFMNAAPLIILAGSFWNVACVFVKVWKCAWDLPVHVTLRLILSLFLACLTFFAQCLPKNIAIGYLVNVTSPAILLRSFWNFADGFLCVRIVCLFVWFDSLRPIHTLSVNQGRVFLGWTSTKLGSMCLAQGPQRSDTGEARTRGPSMSSQALYHWATALPRIVCNL